MPTTVIRGITYHYISKGAGVPVVLLHRYTGTWLDWHNTIPSLSSRYRCIAPDQRGFGKSERLSDPSAYTMHEYVEDIVALASHLDTEKFHLAGISMGGMIAQEFACAHQDMLLSLTLIDTAPKLPEIFYDLINPQITADYLKNHSLEELWDFLFQRQVKALPLTTVPRTPEMIKAARLRYVEDNSPAAIMNVARMLIEWQGVWNRLSEITVRTLVVVGDRDVPFVALSDQMVEALPNARRVVVPESGHIPTYDNPQFFNRAYLEFLNAE